MECAHCGNKMIPVVVSRKGRHLVYGAPVTWQSLNLMRSHYPKVLRVLNSRPGREWFCDVCFDLGKNTLEAYEASLVAEELKGAETYKEHRAFYARFFPGDQHDVSEDLTRGNEYL